MIYSWYFWYRSYNPELPDDELYREEYDDKVVDHLYYEDNPRELDIARGILKWK